MKYFPLRRWGFQEYLCIPDSPYAFAIQMCFSLMALLGQISQTKMHCKIQHHHQLHKRIHCRCKHKKCLIDMRSHIIHASAVHPFSITDIHSYTKYLKNYYEIHSFHFFSPRNWTHGQRHLHKALYSPKSEISFSWEEKGDFLKLMTTSKTKFYEILSLIHTYISLAGGTDWHLKVKLVFHLLHVTVMLKWQNFLWDSGMRDGIYALCCYVIAAF